MKKLLLAAVAVLGMCVSGNAAVINSLGLDPTSTEGAFNHSLGTLNGAFDDQYTFTLDHAMTLTITSVTNVYAQPSDFITNFTGSVVLGTPPPGTLGNVVEIGPVMATACVLVPNCQGFAGSAVLGPGSYFLDISGIANGSSGYGGDLATFSAVPLPGAAWLFGSAMLGMAMLMKRKPKRSPAA
jgi:hypothetical protein